jgi:hypothetical protein
VQGIVGRFTHYWFNRGENKWTPSSCAVEEEMEEANGWMEGGSFIPLALPNCGVGFISFIVQMYISLIHYLLLAPSGPSLSRGRMGDPTGPPIYNLRRAMTLVVKRPSTVQKLSKQASW